MNEIENKNKGNLMTEQISKEKLYEIAILQMRYEGQLLWQRFAAFLTPHTIFLAFLLHAVSSQHLPLSSPGIFWAAIVGIALCVPWFAVYVRSSAYYKFRIAQAREAEPQGWELLAGNAEKFSAGELVQVRDRHRMPWLARKLRTEYSGQVMIIMFFIVYLVLVAITGPWWGKNCA